VTLDEVMTTLRALGSEQTRKVMRRHGAPASDEGFFGVLVGDLKPLAKKIKGDQALALALYDTGNSDAMYLAGLVADGAKMSRAQLDAWALRAPWQMISEYTVAWVASDHPEAWSLANAWINHPEPHVRSSGWSTAASVLSITDDAKLDLDAIRALLRRAVAELHNAPDRVRYTMNGFVIVVGSYVTPLGPEALAAAETIGKVTVNMGGTACKVPLATESIQKVIGMGRQGKKRKTAMC
jgi:3-methyladenine DNA glycosylase AlkD